MVYNSYQYKLLHFCIILILPTIIVTQDFSPSKNCKTIYINKTFIYIINSKTDFKIYSYNEPSIGFNYSQSIINSKDIITINDDRFVIYGLTDNYAFIYEVYSFINNAISFEKGETTNLIFGNIKSMSGKWISGSQIILSVTHNDNFKIYRIDVDNMGYNEKIVPNTINKVDISQGFIKISIQCDSSDGNNFFCFFGLLSTSNRVSYYLKGKFDKGSNFIDSVSKICENCYYGNVIKLDSSIDKYLMCYENELFTTNFIEILCQYYTFKDNNIIIIEDSEEVGKSQISQVTEKSLNLYIYGYSIIIQYDNAIGSSSCMTIISSLDFKIHIQSNFVSGVSVTNNIFNDENNIYVIYEEAASGTIVTKIKTKSFIKCNDPDTINISNDNNKKEYPFFDGHYVDDLIVFSLDTNINLLRDTEIISPSGNNFFPNEPGISYYFSKKETTGLFFNYYAYVNLLSVDYYVYFSLICPLKVIICHHSCKTCNENKIPSSSEHFCKECFSGYYPKESESHNPEFNCYNSNDLEVKYNYYYYNNFFYPCHNSCKACSDSTSCLSCKNSYFFKSTGGNNIKDNDVCYTSSVQYYYLDHNVNFEYNGETITGLYRSCFDTCLYCNGIGTEENNNCITCTSGYIIYPFKDNQCTTDKNECLSRRQFWKLERNTIECISECKTNVVLYGDNKGQCTDDCQNYINPYSKSTFLFTLKNCDGQNYCIPFDICIKGNFYTSYEEKSCERVGECKFDFFNDDDPFGHDEKRTDIHTGDLNPDDKRDNINKRIKIIKMFKNDNDYLFWRRFDINLIKEYIRLLSRELDGENEIYLITTTKYKNFTITIYPLDIEEFTYDKVFISNNLIFANFTKAFPNFINYEIKINSIILVIMIESNLKSSSINDLNYYFYNFYEDTDDGDDKNQIIIQNERTLWDSMTKVEASYPLYNYNNSNSELGEKQKNYLADNIKNMYNKYPDVQLFNLSTPFFSDICFRFTSDVNTDISLNDRRNDYYINISLCEKNCDIIDILNQGLKNPRSVCVCTMKTKFSFDSQSGVKDEFPLISAYNSKAVRCISTAFNKNNVSSNFIFWLMILTIIFLITMIVAWILFGKKEMKKILGFNKKSRGNNNIFDNDLIFFDKKNHRYNHFNKIIGPEQKKNLVKSMAYLDPRAKNFLYNQIESNQIDFFSAPINQSNPPKKIDLKKVQTMAEENEKDLISNSEPSLIKVGPTKNRKNDNYSEISFDKVPSENKVFIDNLLKQKYMLENNYIRNPIEFERLQKIQYIFKGLYSLDNIKPPRLCHSYDDIHLPKNYQKYNLNQTKFRFWRNPMISKIIDGENPQGYEQKLNRSDMIDVFHLQKYKELYGYMNLSLLREEEFKDEDQLFFTKSAFGKNNNISLIDSDIRNKYLDSKYRKRNIDENYKNDFDDNIKISDYNQNMKSTRKRNMRKRLLKAIGRNDYSDYNETEEKKENYNINLIHRTYNFGDKKKRKRNGQNSDDFIFSPNKGYKNNNSLISNESDIANIIKAANIRKKNIKYKQSSKDKNMKDVNNFGLPNSDIDILNINDSNKNYLEDFNNNEKMKIDQNNDFKIFNQKIITSSVSSFLENEANKSILIDEKFFLFFMKYFTRRELGFICFRDKKGTIPYFIRWSCFAFCLIVIFLLNCFFYFESNVHKRYINALKGKKNRFGYYWKNEFINSFYVSILSIIFKMIIIKFVLYRTFKIKQKTKESLRSSSFTNKNALKESKRKREAFLKEYNFKLLIYFASMMTLSILFAYFCICYGGVFPNSMSAFILGFIFSSIFSFILCAFFCLIIILLYKYGKKYKNKCFLSSYIVLSTIY